MRDASGYTQGDLAKLTGMTLSTLKRLEAGHMTNPPLRYLANCALALHVPLDEVVEPEWTSWTTFAADATAPPQAPPPAARAGRPWPPSEA